MDRLRKGVDIGSTTAKIVILDKGNQIQFSDYRRHNAETLVTLKSMLHESIGRHGDVEVEVLVTG